MRIVNLTPHPVVLRGEQLVCGYCGSPDTRSPCPGCGEDNSGHVHVEHADVTIPSSGVARVRATPGTDTGLRVGGVPIFASPLYGEVEGLPAPAVDTIYIVSALVLGRCVGRADVVAPGTGPQDGAVRDGEGRIVAVTRLIQAPLA